VAIVGAGSGGVCLAKNLMQAGNDVTVYEMGSFVGGLWKYNNDNGRSQAYRHLAIITPREKTKFEGFDFPKDAPRFPSHADLYQYIKAYADHFHVTERVRFNTPVKGVQPNFTPGSDAPSWRIITDQGEEIYDAVVIATGHLNEPRHSEQLREFTGEYLHSSAYRTADPFVGKRVAVVGTGNSGVDAASDVCRVAARTVLVARSGLKINPKVVLGVAYPDVAISLRKTWIPAWFRNNVLKAMVYLAFGNQKRLGFTPPTARQHPTSSESIVSDIEFNRVAVKPGIKEIDGQILSFVDGSQEEFDVIIAATGYQIYLPFLSPDIVPIHDDRVDLYKWIFPIDWPGLYFLAMLNPLNAYSQIFEAQSKVIAQHLAGRLKLPPREEMLEDIRRTQETTKKLYTSSPRHGLEESDANYPGHLDEWRKKSLV